MTVAMRLAVIGAAGRMGRALVRLIAETPDVRLCGALARPNSDAVGADAGKWAGVEPVGVAIGSNLEAALIEADGVVDFSTPATSVAVAAAAARAGLVHVVGTTGFSPDDTAKIENAANTARIVKSGNMSLGVTLLACFVEQAARTLPPGAFDIEILEMHHRRKVDAPSGTALLLGQAAATGRAVDLDRRAVRVRDGHTGARPEGAIGFATLRGGSVVGDHRVIFAGEGERIELGHLAEDRSIFARGALTAALWAREREPGLYSMRDVLGL